MREQSAYIDTTAAKHIRQSSKVHMREGERVAKHAHKRHSLHA